MNHARKQNNPMHPMHGEFYERPSTLTAIIFSQENGDYKEVYDLKAAHFFIIYVFLADKFNQKSILTFCKLAM